MQYRAENKILLCSSGSHYNQLPFHPILDREDGTSEAAGL